MQIEIYIDVLFLINLILVFFIFFISNKFLKNRASLKRIFISSFITIILYILMIIFIPFSKIISLLLSNTLIVFSIYICFKPKRIGEFFKILSVVLIVSFVIGGCSIAIFYYINIGNFIGNILSFSIKNISISFLIISIIVSYVFIKFILIWYKKIYIKRQSFYTVYLHKDDNKVALNALLDTGNSLKEPISKKPVIIAEFLAIKNILPDNIKIIFYENEQDNLERLLDIAYDTPIRFIPFKSMGKENGMLIGIKLDKLIIEDTKDIIIDDIFIGICSFNLSKDGFYKALLSPEMLH